MIVRHGTLLPLLALLGILALSAVLTGCGERGVEIQPRGQMVIGGSVGGSTTK